MSAAPDALPMPDDVLVLSPHLDDALLSVTAYALARPSDVWTVFAGRPVPAQRTSWDEACGFADSDETLTTRLAEDEAAFVNSAARVRRLDAWEGAYASRERRREDLRAIGEEIELWLTAHAPDAVLLVPAGAGVRVPEPWWRGPLDRLRPAETAGTASSGHSRPDAGEEAQSLAPLTPENGAASRAPTSDAPSTDTPSREALPQRARRAARSAASVPVRLVQRAMHADHVRRRRKASAGGALAPNPDHIALRDLVLDLATHRPGTTVVLYEELPYLWHGRADAEVAEVCSRHSLLAREVSVDVDVSAKFAHLRHYASQMPVMDTRGRLLRVETLPANERYWVLSPSPTPV